MKRIFILFLTVFVLLSLAACSKDVLTDSSVFETSVVEKSRELTLDDIKNIPELTVSASDRQITALRGTAEWQYSTGEHGCAISSDSMAVPEVGFDLPTIVTSDDFLELSFSLEPDELTVNYWMDAYAFRNTPEKITVSGNTVPVKEGGGYYEVIATWNSATNFGSEVSYGFYRVDPEYLTEPIRMAVRFIIVFMWKTVRLFPFLYLLGRFRDNGTQARTQNIPYLL